MKGTILGQCANIRGLGASKRESTMLTTAFKTSGRGPRRLATNSPHVTLVLAHAGSLRRKMHVAVCVLPGTELAFSSPVTVTDFRFLGGKWKH